MMKLFVLLTFSLVPLLYASDAYAILGAGVLVSLSLSVIYFLTLHVKKVSNSAYHFKALCHSSQEAMLLIQKSLGRIIEHNEAALRLLKVNAHAFNKQLWYERILPAEESIKVLHSLKKQFKSYQFFPIETTVITSENVLIPSHLFITPLPPQHQFYLLHIVPIGVEKRLQQLQEALVVSDVEIQRQKRRFYNTFDMSVNGIAILDSDGRLIYSNTKLQEIFDYNQEYFLQKGLSLLFSDDESLKSLLVTAKELHPIEKLHITSNKRDGETIEIEFSINFHSDTQEYLVIVQDISNSILQTQALKLEMANYEKQMYIDALTQTYNRAYLDKMLTYLQNSAIDFSFILFDIDHFKQVNDTYGHLVGDDVLTTLAAIIKKSLRNDDIFARYGGEEFAIILKHTALKDAQRIAENLRMKIYSTPFKEVGTLTCSFGVAYSDGTEPTRLLIKRADEALYMAKNGGRNRVVIL